MWVTAADAAPIARDRMKSLSEKQQRILQFIQEFLAEHDYPPSIRDIQAGCDISSTSVVDYNLKALETRGQIRRDREVSRGIEIVGGARRSRAVEVPVLGTIAAGQPLPLPTDEGIDASRAEDTIAVTRDMLGGHEDVYALRVKGNSMIDALIHDGDVVLLQPTQRVDDGDMAAVYLRDSNEVTLKRFYREGKQVRLQPMNASMAPIYTAADNVQIQGRVITAIRSM